MPETLKTLIPAAASHHLMGMGSFFAGTASGGTTTTLVAPVLYDASGAQTYRNWYLYIHTSSTAPSLAGTTRVVEPVDLSTATVSWNVNRPLARAPDGSDQFWLLRDFSRDVWRDLANSALQEMEREVVLVKQGLGQNTLRYGPGDLPVGLTRKDEVFAVGTRAFPEVATDHAPRPVQFWWEDNAGSLVLILDRWVAATEELVFRLSRPYADPGAVALSTDTDTTPAPLPWLAAEMVWRALLSKLGGSKLDDQARLIPRVQAAGDLANQMRHRYPVERAQAHRRIDPWF